VGDQQIDQPHPHSARLRARLVGWLNLHGIVLSDPLAAPPTALYRVASGDKARGGGGSQFSGRKKSVEAHISPTCWAVEAPGRACDFEYTE
jgi:hypothetical protein